MQAAEHLYRFETDVSSLSSWMRKAREKLGNITESRNVKETKAMLDMYNQVKSELKIRDEVYLRVQKYGETLVTQGGLQPDEVYPKLQQLDREKEELEALLQEKNFNLKHSFDIQVRLFLMFLCVFLFVCLCVCLCMSVSASVCLSLSFCVCLCLSVSLCLRVYLCVFVSVSVSLCLSLYLCICVSLCLSLPVWVFVSFLCCFVRAFACVSMNASCLCLIFFFIIVFALSTMVFYYLLLYSATFYCVLLPSVMLYCLLLYSVTRPCDLA